MRVSGLQEGWSGAALKFHRVELRKDSTRTRVPQGSTRFHKGSKNVLQGSVEKPLEQ